MFRYNIFHIGFCFLIINRSGNLIGHQPKFCTFLRHKAMTVVGKVGGTAGNTTLPVHLHYTVFYGSDRLRYSYDTNTLDPLSFYGNTDFKYTYSDSDLTEKTYFYTK